MLQYQLFPRSFGINEDVEAVINCCKNNYDSIKSPENNLNSDGVLKIISEDLKLLKFKVEESKQKYNKITYRNKTNKQYNERRKFH